MQIKRFSQEKCKLTEPQRIFERLWLHVKKDFFSKKYSLVQTFYTVMLHYGCNDDIMLLFKGFI